ncbi:MAG: hypothetical protein R3C18_17705 [Planctomycetaceae bacterium]
MFVKQICTIAITAIAFTITGTSCFAQANAPIHGPENNKPLNMGMCLTITVPAGRSVELSFFESAYYENEANIYDQNGFKLASRGNYLNMNNYTWTNSSQQTRFIIVSGWHKSSPPKGGKPWYQSPIRVFNGGAELGVVGFEDSTNGSYDDFVVRYRLK